MRKLSILGLALLTLSALAWQKISSPDLLVLSDIKQAAQAQELPPPPKPSVAGLTSSCLGQNIPYTTGFENDTLNQAPQCWTELVVNPFGFNSYTEVRADFPFRGQNHLSLFTDFADSVLAISPLFPDLVHGNKQIRFVCSSTNSANSLIVGSMDDPTNAASFNPIDTIFFPEEQVYRDHVIELRNGINYNGQDQHLAFMHGGEWSFSTITIDKFSYDTLASCQVVTNPYLTSLSDSSASIDFSNNGGNFKFVWGQKGFTQATSTVNSDSLVGSAPATLSGLSPNTEYELYIFRSCFMSTSDSSIAFNFTTPCAPYNAPYYNGLENDSLYAAPSCWVESLSGNGGNYAQIESYNMGSSAASGTQHIQMRLSGNNNTGDRTALISPSFADLDNNDKQLRFLAATTQGNMSLIIGTVTNPLQPSSFSQIDSIYLPSSSMSRDFPVYQEYVVSLSTLNGYNGNDKYLMLKTSNSSDPFASLNIDEIHYETIPPCSPPLTHLFNLNSKTDQSASFSWSGGQGLTTQVKWGAANFNPNLAGDSISTAASNIILNNLSANTSYDVYLRDSCASGYTYWVGPISFTTDCSILSTPHTELFDNSNWQSGIGFNNGGDQLDNCWSRNPELAGNYRWSVGTGASPGFGSGPAQDRSGSGNYLFSHGSYGFAGDTALLYTPRFDLSSLNRPYLEFWYHRYGAGMPDLSLEIDSSGQWVEILRLSGQDQSTPNDTFKQIGVELTQFPDSSRFRFIMVSTGPNSGDCAIDDFRIDEAPSCPSLIGLGANNLSDSSATLSWSASNASYYEVWFGPSGFYQGSTTTGGTQDTSNTNQYRVDTLQANTQYEFAVRSVCGPGDSSIWAGPFSFKTPCVALSAPYFNGFENSLPGSVPDCYNDILSGMGNIEVSNSWAFTGSQSARLYNDFYPSDIILASPLFTDMNQGDKRLRFRARYETFPESLIVGTLSDPNDASTFSPLDTVSLSGNFSQFIIDISATNGYNGSDQYFGFKHGVSSSFEPIYIDDLHYEVVPACPGPSNLTLASQNGANANINWTSTANSFQFEYGVQGFTIGSGTRDTSSANNASVNLQLANVPNDFYVRAICASGDTSIWTGPFQVNYGPVLCDDFEWYTASKLGGQSNLFFSQNLNDFSSVSTNQANSGTKSLNVAASGFDAGNIGAEFTSIDSGAYKVAFSVYMPLAQYGIVNFFRNINNSDLAFDIYFDNGNADIEVPQGLNPPIILGSFNYNQGQWNDIEQIIDFDQDTCFLLVNGQDMGIGWTYSQGSPFANMALDGVSYFAPGGFFGLGASFYIDDFCIELYDPSTCSEPFFLSTNFSSCDSLNLTFGNTSDTILLEYGLAGFNPGSGTSVLSTDSTFGFSQLQANSHYDFYVQNLCSSTDSSDWHGPVSVQTDSVPLANAAFVFTITDSLGQQYLNFDASSSLNADQYYWDFGNGVLDSGVQASTVYSQNIQYNITLVVSNSCGSDTLVQSYQVNIGLRENDFATLKLYPNPSSGKVYLELPNQWLGKTELSINNSRGELVYHEEFNANGAVKELDLPALAQGLYFIKLNSESGLLGTNFMFKD